jgi:CRP-like cAMP-binding protein
MASPHVDARKLKDDAAEFLRKQKHDKAAEVLEQLVRAEPKDMQHRLRLGDTYRRLHLEEKAVTCYQIAAKHFSDEGQLIKAIGAVKVLLEIDPRNELAQRELAEMNDRRMGKPTLEAAGLKAPRGIGAGARGVSALELAEGERAVGDISEMLESSRNLLEPSPEDEEPLELDDAPKQHAVGKPPIAPVFAPPKVAQKGVLPQTSRAAPPPKQRATVDLSNQDDLDGGSLEGLIERGGPSERKLAADAKPKPLARLRTKQVAVPDAVIELDPIIDPEPLEADVIDLPDDAIVEEEPAPQRPPPPHVTEEIELELAEPDVIVKPPAAAPRPAPAAPKSAPAAAAVKPAPAPKSAPVVAATSAPVVAAQRPPPPPVRVPGPPHPIADLLTSDVEEEIELLSISSEDLEPVKPGATLGPPPPPLQARLPPPPPVTTADVDEAFGNIGVAAPRAAPVAPPPPSHRLPAKVPLFDDLPQSAFVALVNKLDYRRWSPGELILKEGDPGRSFFVIVEGRVRVFKTRGDGSEVELAQLSEGAFFGEMALLSGAPRTANVAALDEVELLEISDTVLRELVEVHPNVAVSLKNFYRQRLLNNVMTISPMFRDFDQSGRKAVVERFKMRQAAANEVLITQGKNSDGLYVVLHGGVKVVKAVDGKEVELARLKEGDVFGEMSLLTRKPATATVTTLSPCIVLKLPRENFQELILTHPQILELVSELTEQRKMNTEAVLSGQGPGHDGMSFV